MLPLEGRCAARSKSAHYSKKELPDMSVEQLMTSLRFEQREKLDQLEIEITTIN
jgi:hypothetical protein